MNKNIGRIVGTFWYRFAFGQPLKQAAGPSQPAWRNGIQQQRLAFSSHRAPVLHSSPPAIISSQLLRASAFRIGPFPQNVSFAVFSAGSRNSCSTSPTSSRTRDSGRRNKSSAINGASKNKRGGAAQLPQTALPGQSESLPKSPKASSRSKVKSGTSQASTSTNPLLDRLPQSIPHLYRPTKAELLEAASGFWSRIKIHFKWMAIRSSRPFNADEIYALFSWVLAAHVLWIVLGTTTFFMLFIFLINTALSQETLGKWIGNYLTKSSGMKVVFETAVVPKWKDGVISFRNVFVSRRPGQGHGNVIKGSRTQMAEAAASLAQQERDAQDGVAEAEAAELEEDTNYTQFDISIETINVTLSFSKWFNGKGLLKDVEIKGIRGVVDRTCVHAVAGVDPRSYKHEHHPGDFELDSFRMEDVLVTIYQPDGFRPFSASIYSCDLPRLRKQWLFYDFLSANMMSGSFDNSLFTIHPRQTHNYTGAQLSSGRDTADGSTWKKHSRIRIDGLNIDHLNRGYDGPFSWIHEGNVDIVADVMLPNDNEDSIAKVMSDMYDRVEATVSQNGRKPFSDHAVRELDDEHDGREKGAEEKRFVILDVRVHLNDVRAAVPIFTRDISYINNALVRPIVAYINAKRAFIPVHCRVVKKRGEFNGSWTMYDSGLMEEVSHEMYDAFARDVLDDRTVRKRRIKKVGIWTLQLAAQALFLGLAGNIAGAAAGGGGEGGFFFPF